MRSLLFTIASLVLLSAGSPVGAQDAPFIRGDCDSSGALDIADPV